VPDQLPVQRRLAAILAGDVVGYSRLMGADEVGTLQALKAIRVVIGILAAAFIRRQPQFVRLRLSRHCKKRLDTATKVSED
jgi:hypothetical protein